MPIIIWGSRGLTSALDSGSFYCPRCNGDSHYTLQQARSWFTLYWIPLFPISGSQRYVECRSCGGTFEEAVLDLEPPSEAQQVLNRVYQDLRTRSSLEDAQADLESLGLEPDRARQIVEEMAEGDTWKCKTCGNSYLRMVKRCSRCR
jgi:predicted RNA-binding Zn-ribbon protein involved in translation (DUF1610 family)